MTKMLEADPHLIARWAEAWAISRGTPPPVRRDGALYIHVGLPEQVGRHIFASLDRDAIRALAATIDRPLLFLKVCAAADAVRPLLPPGWEIATPGYMMTAPVAAMLDRPLTPPAGFTLELVRNGPIVFARIDDPAGEEAAHGRVILIDGLAVFDRIRTMEAHHRKGLGSAIMRALATRASDHGLRDAMLCATPPGRALYTSLGWALHSDYTTASLSPENCATLTA